jgi:superfamily II DNA/RNA helicase
MPFSKLGLSDKVLAAVAAAGYSAPTPIQEQAIPHVLARRDVLGIAQTGTGKTAAFTLPMLTMLEQGRARARMPRTLILEPTREWAAQVSNAFETYGKHHKLTMALLIGGESFSDQERKLDRGVDVLIATPGRLMDLFDRGKILLSDVRILVIDEADRMLDMGFIPDIERIVSLLPKIRQTLFFSATMPPEIRRLADAFLTNPKEITVARPATTAITVTQSVSVVFAEEKRRLLRKFIETEDVKNAIVFCNRKKDVDILHKSLARHGFDALPIHGDLAQSLRTATLDKFRAGEVRILVASDVAARGLDVQGLSHVFNFDVPIHPEDYVHRIGRTGRAGNQGRAFTIATPDEGKALRAVERLINQPVPVLAVEGFEHPEFDADDAPRRRGGRGESAGRGGSSIGGRGERPRRGASRHETAVPAQVEAVTEQPIEAVAEHDVVAERPAKRERSRDRDRKPVKHEPRTDRAGPSPIQMGGPTNANTATVTPISSARGHHRRRDEDDDERVVGFGDHLPAFLARPVKTSARGA